MWHLDSLDYVSDDPRTMCDTTEMWEALEVFTQGRQKQAAY